MLTATVQGMFHCFHFIDEENWGSEKLGHLRPLACSLHYYFPLPPVRETQWVLECVKVTEPSWSRPALGYRLRGYLGLSPLTCPCADEKPPRHGEGTYKTSQKGAAVKLRYVSELYLQSLGHARSWARLWNTRDSQAQSPPAVNSVYRQSVKSRGHIS